LGESQTNYLKTKEMQLLFTSKHLAASLGSSGKAHWTRSVLNYSLFNLRLKMRLTNVG